MDEKRLDHQAPLARSESVLARELGEELLLPGTRYGALLCFPGVSHGMSPHRRSSEDVAGVWAPGPTTGMLG